MKRVDAALGAAGLIFCIVVVTRIGGNELVQQLKAARVGMFVLIGFSFLRLLLQTAAWSTALRAEGIRAPISELIGIRLASQSAGYLSVLGPAIAEPMKVRLILKCRGSGMFATLADSGVYGLTSCILGIVGCVCAGLAMTHTGQVTALVLLCAGLVTGMLMILRSKPALAWVVRSLGRRSPVWLRKGAQIEAEVRQFGIHNPISVCLMFWSGLACQALLVGDVVAIAWCLGIPHHAITVLALEAGTRAARMMAGWIPARIGVDESGAIAAFAALGLPTASGLALALARRVRDLLWCALGFAWLLWAARSFGGRHVNAATPRLLAQVAIGIDPGQAVAVK